MEGFIAEGGIVEGIAEKSVAEGIKEWGVTESVTEESVTKESLAEADGMEAGKVVVIVGEQIKNCVDELTPAFLGGTHGATDMCDCDNALLVAWLAHTHKN